MTAPAKGGIAEAEALHRAGRLAEAEALYRAHLAEHPRDAHALDLLGLIELSTGRRKEAVETLRAAAAAAPESAEMANDLGSALFAAGDYAASVPEFERALALDPALGAARINLGNALRETGHADEAVAMLQRALAFDPDSAEVRNALGGALRDLGSLDEAAAHYRWAIDLRPDYAEPACNLAALTLMQGHAAEALEQYRGIIEAHPNVAAAHVGAGGSWLALGQLDEAARAIERALDLDPANADAHLEMGAIWAARSFPARAEVSFRKALALREHHAATHAHLGNALQNQGRFEDAVACYRRAIEIRPDFPEALNDLGCCLNNQGFHAEAAAALRRALTLRPTYAQAHSNLIFTLDMTPGRTVADDLEEKKKWGRAFAAPLAAEAESLGRDRDPERRIRVGYVSGDFRAHSAAYVIGAVLFNHDHAAFEVFAYSNVSMTDNLTKEFARAADHWRDISGMRDDAVIDLIRGDRIDILVDLSGHTAGNRLRVFARKLAPVQVTAWGYGLGTGIEAIDYILMDETTMPPTPYPAFVEEPWMIPKSFGYRPPEGAPDPAPPPAATNGHFTFGCYNRVTKINDAFLGVVAAILKRAPTARLVIKDSGIDDPGARGRIERALLAGGVDRARFDLLGRTPIPEHLGSYGLIDAALNPFPHGGGVSVMEALWMGVPTLCLSAERAQGRGGIMMIESAGLGDMVAPTEEAYIARAVALAGERRRLAALRRELRGRMGASDLGDQVGFCRSVEGAWRGMWRRWCAQDKG